MALLYVWCCCLLWGKTIWPSMVGECFQLRHESHHVFIFNVTLRLSSEHYLLHGPRSRHTWPCCVLSFQCKTSLTATHRVAALDPFVNRAAERVCGQTWVRPRAGNGQEGIKMSDGATELEWGKKENTKLRAKTFSSFILIAQGHFSPFTLSTDLAIRASL